MTRRGLDSCPNKQRGFVCHGCSPANNARLILTYMSPSTLSGGLLVLTYIALTPNAPDGADDRPHVDRIDLHDAGVLELGDEHINLHKGDSS